MNKLLLSVKSINLYRVMALLLIITSVVMINFIRKKEFSLDTTIYIYFALLLPALILVLAIIPKFNFKNLFLKRIYNLFSVNKKRIIFLIYLLELIMVLMLSYRYYYLAKYFKIDNLNSSSVIRLNY